MHLLARVAIQLALKNSKVMIGGEGHYHLKGISCTYTYKIDFKVIGCMLNDMTFLCEMHERNIQLEFNSIFIYFSFCGSRRMLIVERNFL